jgi:hypothetical protein
MMVADAVMVEPVSAPKFPANREKNRGIFQLQGGLVRYTCCGPNDMGLLSRIPYSTEQGISELSRPLSPPLSEATQACPSQNSAAVPFSKSLKNDVEHRNEENTDKAGAEHPRKHWRADRARLARQYFPSMLKRDWGRVIFISSVSGLVTPGEMVHYGVTKTAQLAISRGLAALTKGTNVSVNSVLPGPTRSEGIIDFLKSLASDPQASTSEVEAEFFAKHRSSSLLQRMIEAEEIANLVAYVASPLSSATNGAALRVDGGVTPTIARAPP